MAGKKVVGVFIVCCGLLAQALDQCNLNIDTLTDQQALSAGASQNGGIIVLRSPTQPSRISNCNYPKCTAIYRVNLNAAYTTQCNDFGMVSPDGLNQTKCNTVPIFQKAGMVDNTNSPHAKNPEYQDAAAALFSVTALTSPTATPLGFHADTLIEYYGVCVQVFGVSDPVVPNRWVEIMAQSKQQDRQFCVTDFDNPALHDNPIELSCGGGEIYTCRYNKGIPTGAVPYPPLKLMFHCQDSCEQTNVDFYWRIVSSWVASTDATQTENQDHEDWCKHRLGIDYPTSLLHPYPANYVPPPVFQQDTSAAWAPQAGATYWFLAALLAVLVVFLL